MKDYIIGLVLTAALLLFFSRAEYLPAERSGTQTAGEASPVLPGSGSEPVELVIQIAETPEAARNESQETAATETETEEATEAESIKEEQKNMTDMLIVFWHGVAAVLIGETSVLVVAIAWLKVRRYLDKKI